ncbi:hypothetical protein SAY87_019310 [Trapa incisa]|uniref:Uncharacterized protein n=1 Tax=Trapa incisa TaxID=236973 RepID=A0AAN7K4A2_9MYRT|nr:hypothetical protein SAY87_019310 [Trapa incisa]
MAASLSLVASFDPKSGNRCQNESRPGASVLNLRKSHPTSFPWMSKHQRPISFRLYVSDGDGVAIDTVDGTVPRPEAEPVQSSTPKSPPQSSSPRRSPLTARERLRAARILSRSTETKPLSTEMGSKVLEALKESEGGKRRRSGLPEAPTNLLDDSKRGLPKEGFTFQFPGGFDLFVIAFSFVFISSVMFATTYLVWKVGAIHFNEY